MPPGKLVDLMLNEPPGPPDSVRQLLEDGRGAQLVAQFGDEDAVELRSAIAHRYDVSISQVLLGHGSGPLLNDMASWIVRRAIIHSPIRIARHLAKKSGYPVVTTEFTYGKVTAAASRRGYQLIQLPMPPDADGRFRLDLDLLDEALSRRPGWVYIVSPNNPTGQVIVEPTDLRRIVVGHRDSKFWIDEAYEGYLAPGRERATSLVAGLDNVLQ